MPLTPEERTRCENFAEQYRLGRSCVMREIERAVWGCDYGSTSWATAAEVRRVAQLLGLGPGKRLLDIGAGSGWPALHLARVTGCDVALVDLPYEGLRIAAERAAADGSAGRCWFAVANGAALPFKAAAFDAIGHSDVLCCLEAKLSVLRDCRRVIRSDGRMVFTVISIAPGLSPADHARAVESGPRFVAAPAEYPALLRQAGWDVADRIDLTAEYAETARRLLREEEARAEPLRELLGVAAYAERLAGHRASLRATEDGLLRRDLFAACGATER